MLRARKLAAALRDPLWRRGLRLGVAPAIEHTDVAWPAEFRTVVDVGAHTGQFALFARRRFPAAVLHCFEPQRDPRRTLERLAPALAPMEVHDCALGTDSRESPMVVSRASDSSSLLPIGEAQVAQFPGTDPVGTEMVRVARLDEELGAPEQRPALLKVDVQGFELEVLEGAGELLGAYDAVLVEASFVELYTGQPLVTDVIRFLGDRGWRLSDVGSPMRDARGAALQADLLFVPAR